MRCFVTGATGFVGSHLCRFLLHNGNEVMGVVRLDGDAWRIRDIFPKLKIIRGDLSAPKGLREQILSFEPEVVFHLAWHGGNSSLYLNDLSQVVMNINGSTELVQMCKEAGAVRWIGLGTSLEYGHYGKPVSEASLPEPKTLYGLSKYCVCLLTQRICQLNGMDFLWLRPFWIYGPFDDRLRMIPSAISKLLRKEKPSLTLGEQMWDYLYVDDAVEAIWRVAMTKGLMGIFNLGSGEVHTIRSIVESIRNLIDPTLQLGLGEVPYPQDQIMFLQADISRLRQATGWSPRISMDEGLRRTVEWYREHQD